MKKSPQEHQEELQAYLTKRMSSEDRKVFETFLEEKKEFLDELLLYKDLQAIGKNTPLIEANHQIMEAMKEGTWQQRRINTRFAVSN